MEIFCHHLQARQTTLLTGSDTTLFDGVDRMFNDSGKSIRLLGVHLQWQLIQPITSVASLDFNLEIEVQLSFGNSIGPEHEIARHTVLWSLETDASSQMFFMLVTPLGIHIPFDANYVEVPTFKGIVSETQSKPRSQLFLNGRIIHSRAGSGTLTFDHRFIANLYFNYI